MIPKCICETVEMFDQESPSKDFSDIYPSAFVKGKVPCDKEELKAYLISKAGDRRQFDSYDRLYDLFNNRYHTQTVLKYDEISMTIWFTDFYLNANPEGYSSDDYFDYEFYRKEESERRSFVSRQLRMDIPRELNNPEFKIILDDKSRFNSYFSNYIHRDWIESKNSSPDEVKDFLSKHTISVIKPVDGTFGRDIRIYDRNKDAKTIHEILRNCGDNDMIMEQWIEQCGELAEFNEGTLNSVRLITYNSGQSVIPTLAVGRFGRKGQCTDNFHNEGLAALIDLKTGIVTSQAIDRHHVKRELHPDSGKKIKGFHYPAWEKLIKHVIKAAESIPQLPHIGWDIAITDNYDIDIIEGNFQPDFDVTQAPDQVGKKEMYLNFLKGDARLSLAEVL